MYVRGEDLKQWTEISLEAQLDLVDGALAALVKGPVEVIATLADGALFLTLDGAMHEASFSSVVGDHGRTIADVVVKPSTIQVHDAAALPRLVSEELRDLAAAMVRGEVVERTRVRALAGLIEAGVPYTLGAVLEQVEDLLTPGGGQEHWYAMYEANQEKIRTSLWGKIREREALVPQTAYSKLPWARLPEFEAELRESLALLGGACDDIVDEIRPLVFDKDNEFLGAIRDSLLAEAQTLHGLLAKVGQLLRADDLGRAAVAHDRLCGRAKTMEVVSAYVMGRAKKDVEATA